MRFAAFILHYRFIIGYRQSMLLYGGSLSYFLVFLEVYMKRFEKLIQTAVDNNEVAGANLLVFKNGKEIIYSQAGYRDLENQVAFDRDTIIRLYSMTKPITAAAAMILMEKGLLEFASPVSDFIPAFKDTFVWDNGKKVALTRNLTVKDLLSMTSGLTYCGDTCNTEFGTKNIFDEVIKNIRCDNAYSTFEIANMLAKAGLAFQPSYEWKYGTGADVMGAIIEIVSGKSFRDFLMEELFIPLEMNDTDFYVPEDKQIRLSKIYESTDNGLVNCITDNLGIIYEQDRIPAFQSGGAGLVSTLDDYSNFASMLLNNGQFKGKKIMSKTIVDYFTKAELFPWQNEYIWKGWEGFGGFTYSNYLRIMKYPGMCPYIAYDGEYGWDGWLGAYFANIPSKDITILFSCQLKDSGTFMLTRKLRNAIALYLEDNNLTN